MLDLDGKFLTAKTAAELAEILGDSNSLLLRGAARDEEMIDLVTGGLITENIGDEAMLALNTGFDEDFIEQLAAAPDKGAAKPDFVCAGRLPD